MKKYSEAIKCFDQAIESDKKNPNIYNNKGLTLNELNRLHEAIECFDFAIKLDSNFTQAEKN